MGQVARAMAKNRGMYDNTLMDDRKTTNANMDYVDSNNNSSIKSTSHLTSYLPQRGSNQKNTQPTGKEGSISTALWKTSVDNFSSKISPKRSWNEHAHHLLQLYGLDSGMFYSLPNVAQSRQVIEPNDDTTPSPDSKALAPTGSSFQQRHNSIFDIETNHDATKVYNDTMEELVALMDQHNLTTDNINTATHLEIPVIQQQQQQQQQGATDNSSVASLSFLSFLDHNDTIPSSFNTALTKVPFLGCQFNFTHYHQQPKEKLKEYKSTEDANTDGFYNNTEDIDLPKPASLETIHRRKILPLPSLRRKKTSAVPQPLPLPSTEFTFESSYALTPANLKWTPTTGSLFSPHQGKEDDLYDRTNNVKPTGNNNNDKRGSKTNNEHESTLPCIQSHASTQNWTDFIQQKPSSSSSTSSSSNTTHIPASSISSSLSLLSPEPMKSALLKKNKKKKVPAAKTTDAQNNHQIKQGSAKQSSSFYSSNKCNNRISNDHNSLDLVALDQDDWVCLFCQYEIFKNEWFAARKKQLVKKHKQK